MKRKTTNLKYAPFIFFLLATISVLMFTSFKKTNNSIKINVALSCTLNPSCGQAKAYMLATYNNSNGDNCAAVVATVNGTIKGYCTQCSTFDPCELRKYAITNFPACHFTMSSFISSCS